MSDSMEQGNRRVKTGVVVKDKMNKTRVIEVARTVRHPLYQKVMRQKKRFMSHDERNQAKVGDRVLIQESRPLSRHKRWTIIKILERAGTLK